MAFVEDPSCREYLTQAADRLEAAEGLLRELTDIEGPQPGHVMWARKVWAFLGIPEPSATSENPDAVYDPVASDGHAGARARQIDDVADDSFREAAEAHVLGPARSLPFPGAQCVTLKQDMRVYYETFPDALHGCDFCSRKFRTVAGLRTHALRMHSLEIDAARDVVFKDFDDPLAVMNHSAADVTEVDDDA